MNMRSFSVRVQLMLLYLVVTLAALILFGLMSFGALKYSLQEGKKTHLVGREQRLIALLVENSANHTRLSLDDQLRNYALVTHEGNLFYIYNADGTTFFPRDKTSPRWISPESNCEETVYRTVLFEGQPILVLCHAALIAGHRVQLQIGGSLEEQVEILRIYRNALLLLMPLLLILSIGIGYLLSSRALKPVDRMTRAALNIGIGNLSERLPVPAARDEIQDLALAWNQLLARLEAAVSRLSQFSADASHDLRTSITVILATAQLSLQKRRAAQEHRDDLEKIVTECHTGATLLDALLSLARSDNFVHEVTFRQIDLDELVVSCCRRVEDLAESSGILLDWRLTREPVLIEGDESLLQRLLGILLDNAIRYTPERGEILVAVNVTDGEAIVTVRDTGVGMSEAARLRVFERFYQADLRERKKQAGSGLGLSIARWIADAHRASLTVESTPMVGSVFQIRFPLLVSPPLAMRP
ncbi:MAG: ATP-binding protein [Edaphobacter sp.]|uniref:ATP-binding protein n=1 Tax=Edaphobacter sp. TaxID=1934404 RepID=UPI002382F5D5|nr:ATP-binding protein [Edaphobacter sp.]MDE1178265.1 ATP-binding protein [Edaphobacter sp.]